WAVVNLAAQAEAAAESATSARISVWCGGVLAAILALFIGLHPTGLRRKSSAASKDERETQTTPPRAVRKPAAALNDRTIVQAPSLAFMEASTKASALGTATQVVQRVWRTGLRNLAVLRDAWKHNQVWARTTAAAKSVMANARATKAGPPAARPEDARAKRATSKTPVRTDFFDPVDAGDNGDTKITPNPTTEGSPPDTDDPVNALWSITRASPQSRLAIEPTMVLPAFGRYTVLAELGKGGMARVYTAIVLGAQGFRRKFVVKRLRPEYIGDIARENAFIDEAKVTASLVHSNILPVLDFGKVGAEYFLATEYILGRDLSRVVQRSMTADGRALSPEVVTFIALELLKALDYAHTKVDERGQPLSIVHRDVSPSNVMVSARGEVKLFDFGVVKAQGRIAARTEMGVVKGNLGFMAPEQAQGRDVDARADLFSLALVLYHCLTGERLYRASADQRLLQAARGPGPDELKRVKALPFPFGPVLTKALAVDPEARFASAADFASALASQAGRASAGGAAL
ncbi:MAG TPA: serine/threonine-protein kinase, partial [Polyangia bacterium]